MFRMATKFADLPFIYNVTQPVGMGRPNKRDDVVLVQVLLQMANATILDGGCHVGSTAGIKVDGYFGQQTYKYIRSYQQEQALVYQRLIAQDGLIEPAPPSGYTSKGWLYTIIHLNRSARENDELRYASLQYRKDSPPELWPALPEQTVPTTGGA